MVKESRICSRCFNLIPPWWSKHLCSECFKKEKGL